MAFLLVYVMVTQRARVAAEWQQTAVVAAVFMGLALLAGLVFSRLLRLSKEDSVTVGIGFAVRNVVLASAAAITLLNRTEYAVFAVGYFLLDRSSLFQFSPDGDMILTHSWVAPGFQPFPPRLDATEHFPWGYYRLNAFPIAIPPLRERAEDIPALAWAFADELGRALGKPVERIPQEVMAALQRYPGGPHEEARDSAPGVKLQSPWRDSIPRGDPQSPCPFTRLR